MNLLRLPLALLALFATACATTPAAPPVTSAKERPAFLWEVTRPDAPERRLYLTGSIHLGRPGQFVFPPSMEAALARSQALVVELDPQRADPTRVQTLVMGLGLYPASDKLSAHLSEKTRELLPEALERVKFSPLAAERMRPWLLYLTLSVMEIQRVGYSEEGGIDRLLMGKARGTHRLVELETVEEQLRSLAGLPDPVQDLFLRELIEQAPKTEEVLTKMIATWEQGDPEALEKLLFEQEDNPTYQPFYEALFYQRNRRMAERMTQLFGEPDTHFVVVGAGHLVGKQGLVALLENKGFQVRQLPREP